MSGSMPCFRIRRPSAVSHWLVPSSNPDPSLNVNGSNTVPVPNVVSPSTGPRSASWIAPAKISEELAEPRLISTVSDPRLKPALEQYGVRFTHYEGPASFSSYLLTEACERGLQMATLVAEIPPYIHGTNPRCIESVVRKIAAMLGLGRPRPPR